MLDSEIRALHKFFCWTVMNTPKHWASALQGCSYKPPQEPNNCGFSDDSHPLWIYGTLGHEYTELDYEYIL